MELKETERYSHELQENRNMLLSNSDSKGISAEPNEIIVYKTYKKRWFILALYCLSAMSNVLQFVLYSVIADILVDYYGISYTLAQWTALISGALFIVFCFPGAYLIDKLGVRWAVIIGIIGNGVGAWIKVASVSPERYWVLLLGQAISTSFQVLTLPLPPKIASVWFGKDEVSKACGIALSGLTASVILGYVLSPLVVKRGTKAEIESGLSTLAYLIAIIPSVLLPLVFLFFSNNPPTPPSKAQFNIEDTSIQRNKFKDSIVVMCCNKSYMLLLVIHGISYGMDYPIGIILNQLVLKHHPSATSHIGYLGATSTFCGLFGSFAFGYILDKFKRYRATTITVYVLHAVFLILLMSTLSLNVHFIYFTYGILGFTTMGLVVITYELATELIYPEPEFTAIGFITMCLQIFGISFTYLYEFLLNNSTEMVTNITIACLQVFAVSLVFFIKFELGRQNLENQNKLRN